MSGKKEKTEKFGKFRKVC